MTSATAEVRWGMIGCGSVAEVKSRPAFSRVPFSKLQAVSGRRSDRIADYAARHAVPSWYEDPEDLIRDPQVNAIYVATPPSSHCRYALLAAAHGKPVYVEKPMALTASEGAMMNAACAKAGVPIFIAYYRRCLPRFLKVAELLHGEAVLGTIRFVRTCLYRSLESRYQDPSKLPWNVQPEISGGGLFVDLGSHTLDILDFLLCRSKTSRAMLHHNNMPIRQRTPLPRRGSLRMASLDLASGILLLTGEWMRFR